MPRDLASSSGFVPGLVKNVRLLEWTTWNSRGGRKKKKSPPSVIDRFRYLSPRWERRLIDRDRFEQFRTIFSFSFVSPVADYRKKKETERERKKKKFEGNDTILTPITCWRCAARVLKQRRKGMVISIHG